MLYFFSFCCLIEKQQKHELLYALELLIKSLDKYVINYKFIIYTNFELNINHSNLKIRKYYNHEENKLIYGTDIWRNLSMNKIFIYKELNNEFNIDYIWIDLDTYVYNNLQYLENLDNFFIEYGGEFKRKDKVATNYNIEFHKYIQGNFWKLNLTLYQKLINLLYKLISLNIKLTYDSQSLFTYYFYKILNGNFANENIHIIGNTIQPHILNGISIWGNKNEAKHANINGLNNLYVENEILKSKFHNNKHIHIVSFTFNTLIKIKDNKYFKELF